MNKGLRNYGDSSNPGIPRILNRQNPKLWGKSTDRIIIPDNVNALSIGPDSDVAAYWVKPSSGYGPFVLSLDCPYLGFLQGPIEIEPILIASNDAEQPENYLFRYRADIIAWDIPPMFFPTKRRPRYMNSAEVADTGARLCVHGRKKVRFVLDAGPDSDFDVTVDADFQKKLPEGLDGSLYLGAIGIVSGQIPDASTSFLVPASTLLYKEIDLTTFGVSGADWLFFDFTPITALEFPAWWRIEAHD